MHHKRILDSLDWVGCEVSAIDKIPDDGKYHFKVIEGAQNRKQIETGLLEKLIDLKVRAKVMVTVNVDIQDS